MERKQGGIQVNYLYFGLFFIILILLSGSSLFAKEQIRGSRIFFCLYAAGQVTLETVLFIFVCWVAGRFAGKATALVWIGTTFSVLILHLLDFAMNRILDLSILETIGFVLDESFENFLYLLDASGIPLWAWIAGFTLLASLPFAGVAIYQWTFRIVCNRSLRLPKEWCLQAFLCIPAALLFWEFTAARMIHPDSYTAFLQSLPWKWTFLQPRTVQIAVPATLRDPRTEEEILAALANDKTILTEKPNVYLFIIESLRDDFITPAIAPSLSRFRKESLHFDLALSNGNGSHLSWFSLFHSQFPYCWNHLQSHGWKTGSPPLQLLKKWGYKVRLYTSAQLQYYDMEKLLFGQGRSLIDSYQTFYHPPPLSAAQTDEAALMKLQLDLLENPDLHQGQIFIVFWDSTHFNYSWPKNSELKFSPISNDIDYFQIFQTDKKTEMIKNRYRNAIFHLDSLFARFLDFIPDKENAIVIAVGDHGEEFFERGHLFHGSHLTHEQTHIPMYMKFGQRLLSRPPKLVSQMDIFPSLLHHLSGQETSFLEGASIFSENRWPFAFISRFNAGRTPYEFCVHNGDHKLIARFEKKKDIFQSHSLHIRSLWGCHDQCLIDYKEEIPIWVKTEFGAAIERLFSPRE